MKILNRTHYYSDKTRVFNEVLDTNTFNYQASVRLSYYQRLYFEHKYTTSLGGQSFYYTFTYNNKALPQYQIYDPDVNDIITLPCFSYDDIRIITNGVISKVLDRQYGSRLRYFVVCESGEGKGKRGKGYNSHYHVIFFVQPKFIDEKPDYTNYKVILPQDFCKLVKSVWQDKADWNKARFGHVQPGFNYGYISGNEGCFKYVGKYILKSDRETAIINKVSKCLYYDITSKGYDFTVLYNYYRFLRYINPYYSREQILDYFKLPLYFIYSRSVGLKRSVKDYLLFYKVNFVEDYSKFSGELLDFYSTFYVPNAHKKALSDWKNQYSSKVRLSKSLGLCGINSITNLEYNPRVQISETSGYKLYYPCLYYIRHLYYNVVKCPITGNPLYILNELGIKYKTNRLSLSIEHYVQNTSHNIQVCDSFKYQIPSFVKSVESYNYDNLSKPFYNISIGKYEDSITCRVINKLTSRSDYLLLLRIYSIYNLVYRYRHYTNNVALDNEYSLSSVLCDYSNYLRTDFFIIDYEDLHIDRALLSVPWHSFSSHPLFRPYIKLFNFLDDLNDYISDLISEKKKSDWNIQKEYIHRMKVAKFNVSL